MLSLVAVLCTLMCTTSRAVAAMAQLRMLPARLAQLHPTLGTPAAAVVANALMVGLASSLLRFEILMELSMCPHTLQPEPEPGGLLEPQPQPLAPTQP